MHKIVTIYVIYGSNTKLVPPQFVVYTSETPQLLMSLVGWGYVPLASQTSPVLVGSMHFSKIARSDGHDSGRRGSNQHVSGNIYNFLGHHIFLTRNY